MSTASLASPGSTALTLPDARWLAAGVTILAVAGRFASGWITPFGFDEAFSGVISSQPDVRTLISWCLNEIGGPVYYVLLWCWSHVFGTSLPALRGFSMMASLATPLVILRWGHPDRVTRFYWAVMMALWLPAFGAATNGRCYALLMLETTAQAIAFRSFVVATDRRHAVAWVGLSVLAVLTHYHAAILAGVQGLLILMLRPRAALRCWPALLLLIPMAAWMAFHLSLLARFATQGAWYALLKPSDLVFVPELIFGSIVLGAAAVLAAVVALLHPRWHLGRLDRADVAVVLSGVMALAILLAIGMLRSSFTPRYTTIMGPAILFGLAAWIRHAGRDMPLLPTIAVALFAATAAGQIGRQIEDPVDDVRYNLNLGQPWAWLGEKHAHRVGFLWDSPTGRISEASRIAEVIGFGPRQAGYPMAVTVLQDGRARPSRIIHAAINARRIDSLIWLADQTVPGTLERPDVAMLRRLGWSCRDFGGSHISMLTCRAGARMTM